MIPSRPTRPSTWRSKPRASGDDPKLIRPLLMGPFVNPARAGMIPGDPQSQDGLTGKPRASGDDPTGAEFFSSPQR